MHIIDTYVKAMKIKVGNDEYNQITETYRTRLADKKHTVFKWNHVVTFNMYVEHL